jgi:hypothetical protein
MFVFIALSMVACGLSTVGFIEIKPWEEQKGHGLN